MILNVIDFQAELNEILFVQYCCVPLCLLSVAVNSNRLVTLISVTLELHCTVTMFRYYYCHYNA